MGRGRWGETARPFLRGSRRRGETTPSFSRVCVGAAKGRGSTAFLSGLALREAREVGAAFSSGPVPGGLEESWGDLSPGSAAGEAKGRDNAAFLSRPALGEARERWVRPFFRILRQEGPGKEMARPSPQDLRWEGPRENWVRPFFRSLRQEGPGKEIAQSSPQDLRREERGENWVRPFFRSLRQEGRGENWVQPFFRSLRQEGSGKEIVRPSPQDLRREERGENWEWPFLRSLRPEGPGESWRWPSPRDLCWERTGREGRGFFPRDPPGRGSSSAELSFNGDWGRRRGWPLSTAPAWAG